MERNKMKRTATKGVVDNLVTKIKNLNIDDITEQENRELLSTINVIELKMSQIEALNEKILDEINPEDMALDMEVSAKFEIDVNTELEKFRRISNPALSSTREDALNCNRSVNKSIIYRIKKLCWC